MSTYYNDNDLRSVAILHELIADGLIPPGDVDGRSVRDVRPDELRGYNQCHFFAGIGGWPLALHLAGWLKDRPVWTASFPCQPLSSAGQRKEHTDERHLWPAFFPILAECRPATCFGEQAGDKATREWFAGIRLDMEAVGYACGGADLCAAGVKAPHKRQRLYWVANANLSREYRWASGGKQSICDGIGATAVGVGNADNSRRSQSEGSFGTVRRWTGDTGDEPLGVANAGCLSPWRSTGSGEAASGRPCDHVTGSGYDASELGDTTVSGSQEQWREYRPSGKRHSGLVGLAMQVGVPKWNGPTIAVRCSDGARRVSAQPDAFPLAHGVFGRMGKLHGAGNAIIPQGAAEFIRAFLETEA